MRKLFAVDEAGGPKRTHHERGIDAAFANPTEALTSTKTSKDKLDLFRLRKGRFGDASIKDILKTVLIVSFEKKKLHLSLCPVVNACS